MLSAGNKNDLRWTQEGKGSQGSDRLPQSDLHCIGVLPGLGKRNHSYCTRLIPILLVAKRLIEKMFQDCYFSQAGNISQMGRFKASYPFQKNMFVLHLTSLFILGVVEKV